MKFSFAAILLLASTAEATKLKTKAQMEAEIQAMSMNANMHQVSLREKTLLKTYLEVDMNEFLQQKMDSELFNGVDEKAKSEFIGNFFHFIKCRFQDCNLVQTKSKINMKQKSESPTAAESKKREDEKNLIDWGSGKGNHVPAHSENDKAYVQINASSPTAAESKKREDDKNVADWGSGKGNHVPAHSKNDKEYVQTDKSKKVIMTPTSEQVIADLKKEKADELVKPQTKAGNEHDPEPTNVQTNAEVKK